MDRVCVRGMTTVYAHASVECLRVHTYPHMCARTQARRHTQAHRRALARPHAHARRHTCARAHARIHARTHARTHTHTCTDGRTGGRTDLYMHARVRGRTGAYRQPPPYASTQVRTHTHVHLCTFTHAHFSTCARTHSMLDLPREPRAPSAWVCVPGHGGLRPQVCRPARAHACMDTCMHGHMLDLAIARSKCAVEANKHRTKGHSECPTCQQRYVGQLGLAIAKVKHVCAHVYTRV